MKNNFIKIVLNQKNEFRTLANIAIPSIGVTGFEDINVKIDTGCSYTSIPVQKLGLSEEIARHYKKLDSDNNSIKKEISFGVNDSTDKRNMDKHLYKNKEYMKLTSITFVHSDVTLRIMDMEINVDNVKLSYDRTGNILIGMDILKNWDIHIGKTASGETLFLACPLNQLNDEYYKELSNLFDIGKPL